MKLYLLSRPEDDDSYDYDTYKNAVVCAESEEDALTIHPAEEQDADYDQEYMDEREQRTWTKNPQAILLGEAADNIPRGVVLAYFLHG